MGKLGALSSLGRSSRALKLRDEVGAALSISRKFSTESEEPRATNEISGGTLELWTWGKGESGQLGQGDEETRKTPSRVKLMSFPTPTASLGKMPGRLSLDAESSSSNAAGSSHEVKGRNGAEMGAGDSSQAFGSEASLRSMHTSGRGADPGVGIACGLFHSALWKGGQLWLWGKGAGGRLGLGSEESQYVPSRVMGLRDVSSVGLGGLHCAAIAEGGSVFTWGFGGFGALGHGNYSKQMLPQKLMGESWMDDVKHIAAGGSHTAAISSSGTLYTWGRDEGEGRLGHGPGGGRDEGSEPRPVKVGALPVPVAAVACGGFCTMALTSEGQLWSWGGNSNFELGRGNRRDDWRPRLIPEVENICVRQVACGGYHAAALTDDGKVLTWGHGGHGQLGHGSLQSGKVPTIIEALASKRVVHISCGSSWTAAVTEAGELYTWGKNRDYQLGAQSLSDSQMTPHWVTFDKDWGGDEGPRASNPKVICVSAGATHGMALEVRR